MEFGDAPFYWQPPPAALHRRRRPPSPPILGSSLAIILLPCLALILLFFVAHRLSHMSTSQYNVPDYPHQISDPIPKLRAIYNLGRSWDALSVGLIVAAILCGVFARRHERIPSPPGRPIVRPNPNFVVLRNEYGNHCRMQNQFCVPTFQQQHLQQQQWLQFAHDQRNYGFYPNGYNYAWHREEQQVAATAAADDEIRSGDGIEIKEIPMETFEHQSIQNSASESPSPPNTPPASPPRPVSRAKPKRSYQSVPRKEKVEKPVELQNEKKLKPRKSNGTKEIAAALASLYGERKTKRKQQNHNKQDYHGLDEKTVQDDISLLLSRPSEADDFLHRSSNYTQIRYLSSDLPPPPAAPSSRHSNRKNQIPPISQIPTELPAADPLPRLQTTTSAFKSRKPPLPTRSTTYNDGDESSFVSRKSNPTLPPPTRPPSTITETNFSLVRNDRFVRARSPPTGSPAPEEVNGLKATVDKDASRPSDEAGMNGEDGSGASPSIFCPSPDVDAKADMFIARHRDSWRLERLNSWREKRT